MSSKGDAIREALMTDGCAVVPMWASKNCTPTAGAIRRMMASTVEQNTFLFQEEDGGKLNVYLQ